MLRRKEQQFLGDLYYLKKKLGANIMGLNVKASMM
jgi:hypothetical protein